jgi:hypothetical protein
MLYWAVDLYDEEKLDGDMITELRTNRTDIAKANSDGIFLSVVVDGLKEKPLDEQKHILSGERALAEWAHRITGLPLRNCARLLAILRHDDFQREFREFVSTTYGQEYFQFALGELIVNSKLDHVSYPFTRNTFVMATLNQI